MADDQASVVAPGLLRFNACSRARQEQHCRDHVAERHGGLDLMMSRVPQQWFDGLEIVNDALSWPLPPDTFAGAAEDNRSGGQ